MKKLSVHYIITLSKLALIAALLCGTTHASRADTAPVDQVLAHFESVVFGNEYEIEGIRGATQIQKWVSPVRIDVNAMTGEVKPKPGGGRELKLERVRPSADQISLVRKHLTTLVRMTGVK